MRNEMAVYTCSTTVVASSKRVRLYTADAAVRFYEPARQAECFIGKKA
jgi:hypothetical protein